MLVAIAAGRAGDTIPTLGAVAFAAAGGAAAVLLGDTGAATIGVAAAGVAAG